MNRRDVAPLLHGEGARADLDDMAVAMMFTGAPYRGALLRRMVHAAHAALAPFITAPADHVPPHVRTGTTDSVRPGAIVINITGDPRAIAGRLVDMVAAERAMCAAPLRSQEGAR